MRRLLRWAFNLAAVVSAVLFVGVCVLWVRSYRVADVCQRSTHRAGRSDIVAIAALEWGITLIHEWRVDGGPGSPAARWEYRRPARSQGGPSFMTALGKGTFLNRCGFLWFNESYPAARHVLASGDRVLIVPLWCFALSFAVPPALFGLGVARARRSGRRGRCVHCGYDLRATPDRCPECGRAPARKGATA